MSASGIKTFEAPLKSCQQPANCDDLRRCLCQLLRHFLLECGFVDAVDAAAPDDLSACAIYAFDVTLVCPREKCAERFVESGMQVSAEPVIVEDDEIRRSALGQFTDRARAAYRAGAGMTARIEYILTCDMVIEANAAVYQLSEAKFAKNIVVIVKRQCVESDRKA